MRRNNVNISVADVFPKHHFWEYKIDMLDFKKDKELIIPRALYFSDKESFNRDVEKLETIYSKKEIVRCINNTREAISNEVCELIAIRYNANVKLRF